MLTDKTVPCICCGSELVNVYPSKNQPNLALEFTTLGHYGSTEFDPMDGTMLAVNICDPCLRDRRAKGHILLIADEKYQPWKEE